MFFLFFFSSCIFNIPSRGQIYIQFNRCVMEKGQQVPVILAGKWERTVRELKAFYYQTCYFSSPQLSINRAAFSSYSFTCCFHVDRPLPALRIAAPLLLLATDQCFYWLFLLVGQTSMPLGNLYFFILFFYYSTLCLEDSFENAGSSPLFSKHGLH